MLECKPVSTPMVTQDGERKGVDKNIETKGNHKIETNHPYREAIGSLLYLANGTRPDITYAVNVLSRHQSSYTDEDWVKVKRVLRYLRDTVNLGLKYTGSGDSLECFVDASLGISDINGKSTSSIIVKLFNDIIFWRTKKQTHVALSSMEAEDITMSLGCKELVSMKKMCKRIIRVELIPIMYEDSKSAINFAKSDESQTLKHIAKLCFHYVKLEISKKNIIIKWVGTNDQLADALTKAVGKTKFEKFRNIVLSVIDDY